MSSWFFVIILSLIASAYTDRSFAMEVQVQPDGSAHVVEKSYFILDNKNEVDAFEFVLRQGKTTLVDWQKFSRNIRYHVLGPINLRIVAAREFQIGFTTASVTLEYDVRSVVRTNQTGSRTTHYQLDTEKLQVGSATGELTLGSNVVFVLHVPSDVIHLKVSPDVGAFKEGTTMRWVGPTSGRWDVSYDREITLAQEVQQFFLDLYSQLLSSYLLWFLLLVALSVVVYKFVQTRHH